MLPYKILLVGVGGTGVVTVNALLSTAAAIEEKQVMFLDQTGLSQKGGAVLSNLIISNQPIQHSNKIGAVKPICCLALIYWPASRPIILTVTLQSVHAQ